MGDDWDLHAVVRGCATTTTTTTTTATTWLTDAHSVSNFETLQDDIFMCFPDLFQQDRQNIEELHDLYKPFYPKSQPLSPENIPISPLSVLGGLQDLSYQTPLQINEPFAVTRCANRHSQSTPKLKRRKNQLKRVCQVPAEGLSSDMWSWRKYGQKPIKGSPYPRGYYRCSTSKSCLARKQVERNRSDPAMFIVTYTGEHNHPMPTHRNSLAGSTRQKPVTSGETIKPTCSSPATTNSPATVDEDEEFGVSDMVVNDDFFMGLEEFCS